MISLDNIEKLFSTADSCSDVSRLLRSGMRYVQFIRLEGLPLSGVRTKIVGIALKISIWFCRLFEKVVGSKRLWYTDVEEFGKIFFNVRIWTNYPRDSDNNPIPERNYINFGAVQNGLNYIRITKFACNLFNDVQEWLGYLAKASESIGEISAYGKDAAVYLGKFLSNTIQEKCSAIATIFDFMEQCRKLVMDPLVYPRTHNPVGRLVNIAKDVIKLTGTAATLCATSGLVPVACACTAINAAISLAALRWSILRAEEIHPLREQLQELRGLLRQQLPVRLEQQPI